ncbi:hypothetical protein GCM10022206_41810 [Streptomyces chiangmaiensis]
MQEHRHSFEVDACSATVADAEQAVMESREGLEALPSQRRAFSAAASVRRTASSVALESAASSAQSARRCEACLSFAARVKDGSLSPESSRTNADDRLPVDPLGRVKGSDGIVEGCDLTDVRP